MNDQRPCPFTAMRKASHNDPRAKLIAECFYVAQGGDWQQVFACMRMCQELDLATSLSTHLGGYFFGGWDFEGESESDCVRLQELASEYLYPTEAKP